MFHEDLEISAWEAGWGADISPSVQGNCVSSAGTIWSTIGITGMVIFEIPNWHFKLLNANWHHGDGHISFLSWPDAEHACSTPIGITGTGMRQRGRGQRQLDRLLNSNWHDGDGHN